MTEMHFPRRDAQVHFPSGYFSPLLFPPPLLQDQSRLSMNHRFSTDITPYTPKTYVKHNSVLCEAQISPNISVYPFLSPSSRTVWVGSSNHICRMKTHGLQTNISGQSGTGWIPSGGRAQISVESLRGESWIGEHRDGMRSGTVLRAVHQGTGLVHMANVKPPPMPVQSLLGPWHLPVKWYVGSIMGRAENPYCGEVLF